jgi:hypothetical protein
MKNILQGFLFIALIGQLSACSFKSEITPFTVETSADFTLISVTETGEIKIMEEAVGHWHVNGVILNNDKDTLVQRKEDGTMLDNNRKPFAKILDNGSIDFGSGQTLEWNEEGKLMLGPTEFLKITPNNPATYVPASCIFLLYSIGV